MMTLSLSDQLESVQPAAENVPVADMLTWMMFIWASPVILTEVEMWVPSNCEDAKVAVAVAEVLKTISVIPVSVSPL